MKTTDMLGCAGGAAFFLLAGVLFPFAGLLFALLTPLPFLFYSSKLGLRQGVKLTALVVVTIGLAAKLAGYPELVVLVVEFGLLGIAISVLFQRNLSIGGTVFLATAFMVILGLGVVFFLALSRDMGPLEFILRYVQEELTAVVRVHEGMGTPQEKILEIKRFGKAVTDIISKFLPALVITGSGFVVWLNIIMARPLFRMKHLHYPRFVPFDRWHAPDRLIWGAIGSGFALFLSSPGIRLVAVNALIVLMAIYFFHGLSITLFFLNRYQVPSLMRVALYVLIMVLQLLVAMLALAGVFDQWLDIRRIRATDDGQAPRT